MANIIGSGPNQIPTNASLGKLAYADYLDMSDIPNPFIVSSNNTEALRIKQTGTGNILYAVDSNDNERVYINNVGYLRLTSNSGSAYGGISLKNTYGSANVESKNFIDFQNDLGVATGAIFNTNEAYTGGSYISLYTTANGSRSSDRRAEAMRIDANGNIGIGHAAPSDWYSSSNRLVVNQSANSVAAIGIGNATSGLNAACALKYVGGTSYSYTTTGLYDNNGSPYFSEIHGSGVSFRNWTMNGAEKMRLDAASGNLGVGTISLATSSILAGVPSATIHVNTGTSSNTAFGSNTAIRVSGALDGGNLSIFDIMHYRDSTAGTGWNVTATRMQQRIDWTWMAWQQFNGYGNPSGISWGTGSGSNRQDVAERMRLDSSGNLGIGTNNPSNWGKFVVAGTSSGGVVVSSIVNTSGTNNTQAVLSFDTTNNGFNVRDCQIRATNNGLNQSTLQFYTSDANTPAERMRITATGNLGIGTSSPLEKLHVYTPALTSQSIQDANSVIRFVNANGKNYIQSGNTLTSAATAPLLFTDIFAINEWMRITATGNVGIGTSIPLAKLHTERSTDGTVLRLQRGGGTNIPLLNVNLTESSKIIEFEATGAASPIITWKLGGTERIRFTETGNVLIGTSTDGGYKLQVNGSFAATTKSFVIDHPTKPDMKLRYGSLEGPENGVYVRGRLKNSNVIELPDYWTELVHEDTITVNLTAIGKSQDLWVEDIVDNTVIVGGDNINCFYTVFAERKDVEKLIVEF